MSVLVLFECVQTESLVLFQTITETKQQVVSCHITNDRSYFVVYVRNFAFCMVHDEQFSI